MRLLCALLMIATLGCAGDVPSPALVEDLRVLAIRAEPPELLIDRDDPAAAVAFEALVVDPRGPSMVYEWRFCPVESSQTCGDYQRRRDGAAPEFRPGLDAARAERRSGQAMAAPSGPLGVETFTVAIPPSVFAYHLASSGLGLGNGGWMSAVLELQAGTEMLLAQKRVVLNARDLSQWNPELARFGWQVCTAEPAPGCIPLAPRAANRNPAIAAVELARGDGDFQSWDGPVTLAPGELIRLRPVLGPDAEEHYQAVESTLQGNHIVVVDRTEEAIASWFATGGKLGDEQTTRQLTKTLDTTFTAPASPGRIALYIVVRDQRGGVGWRSLEILVE